VAQIGRELEREQRVVEVQELADVLAERRVGRQFEQAAVVLGQLELARRAQHAEALDAAQLALADLERLAVLARRQFGADGGERNADASTRVGGTADDLQRAVRAVRTGIDRAHAQLVGVRVLFGFEDLGDDDAVEGGRDGALLFDFHAGHRQQMGQRIAAQFRVAELAQPRFGELHCF